MNSLAIPQKHYAKKTILHLRHLHSPTNAAVLVDMLTDGSGNGPLNPFVSNSCPICPNSNHDKAGGDLHASNVANGPETSTLRPDRLLKFGGGHRFRCHSE